MHELKENYIYFLFPKLCLVLKILGRHIWVVAEIKTGYEYFLPYSWDACSLSSSSSIVRDLLREIVYVVDSVLNELDQKCDWFFTKYGDPESNWPVESIGCFNYDWEWI